MPVPTSLTTKLQRPCYVGTSKYAMAALCADRGPLFKVILLGEAGVGKTAIFHRAKENSFNDTGKTTVGIDSFSLYVKVGDQQVTVRKRMHNIVRR